MAVDGIDGRLYRHIVYIAESWRKEISPRIGTRFISLGVESERAGGSSRETKFSGANGDTGKSHFP